MHIPCTDRLKPEHFIDRVQMLSVLLSPIWELNHLEELCALQLAGIGYHLSIFRLI